MPRLFNSFNNPPAPEHNIKNLSKKFETFTEADERRNAVVRLLVSGSQSDLQIAKKIIQCRKGRRCLSSACPICRRGMRTWFVGALLKAFEGVPNEQMTSLTILSANLQYGPGQIQNSQPRNAVNRLTAKLKRSSFTDEVIVGALDYDWCVRDNECCEGYWQVHYHLISVNLSETQIEKLRSAFPNQPNAYIRQAVDTKPINDRVAQFSYVLKPFFQKRSSYLGSDGLRRTKKQPIKNAERHRELLRHLDQHPLTESLVFYHARREGGVIRRTIPIVDDKFRRSVSETTE